MIEEFSLTDNFLIAMPNMDDPSFLQSVIYICEHNEHGALGIVINKSIGVGIADIFSQMEIVLQSGKAEQMPILFGGPIHQERGFVIHSPEKKWRSTLATSSEIMITTSRDILEDIANNAGPQKAIIALGYAGWGAGQLEEELGKNIWLHCKANPGVMFDIPIERRWIAAASLLGIDINTLSGDIGHA